MLKLTKNLSKLENGGNSGLSNAKGSPPGELLSAVLATNWPQLFITHLILLIQCDLHKAVLREGVECVQYRLPSASSNQPKKSTDIYVSTAAAMSLQHPLANREHLASVVSVKHFLRLHNRRW